MAGLGAPSRRRMKMKTIERKLCASCGGTGNTPGQRGGCRVCRGSGERFVPQGYTQAQIEVVRHLVDAMAVQQQLHR